MAKDYEANAVQDLIIKLKLSTPSDPVKINNEDTVEYYAARLIITARATGESNMIVGVPTINQYLGEPKSQPWTVQEVGNAFKNYSTLHTLLFNHVKSIYQSAISFDIDPA